MNGEQINRPKMIRKPEHKKFRQPGTFARGKGCAICKRMREYCKCTSIKNNPNAKNRTSNY